MIRRLLLLLLTFVVALALLIFLQPLVALAQEVATPAVRVAPAASPTGFGLREIVAVLGLLQTISIGLIAWVLKVLGQIAKLDKEITVLGQTCVRSRECEAHRANCPTTKALQG